MTFNDRNNGRFTGDGVPKTVASIPLADADARIPGQSVSIGDLVKDATSQVSALFRAEVELAKSEVTSEVKKGVKGSIFFVVAGVILLFSLFFFFFFLGHLLNEWLWTWAAWGIVFLIMVFAAAVCGLIGYLKVRKLKKPEHTIESVKGLKGVLPTGDSFARRELTGSAGPGLPDSARPR
ncbi:phage holin family protein [Hoyosella rhizosphaerae]|uniref:Membrane protein n=1 Tax=Hoyosella rhizosphaerae TaxID=1755582 RepID=A0A916XJH0_9ACTN|nr:phage holin family protein [Hoyosella rhizosphaerae]MBN4925358.1 phage holin family protein [Hoyosella rhizosphaerae]GGC75879.1 membrane protein [Hoyosella rhizosphaerae]